MQTEQQVENCPGFGFYVYKWTKAWAAIYFLVYSDQHSDMYGPLLSFCFLHLWRKIWDSSTALRWPSWSQSCLWRRSPSLSPSRSPSLYSLWSAKYPESALPWPAGCRTTQRFCSVVNNRLGRFGFEYRERNGCASAYSTNWLLAGLPAAAAA